MAFELHRREFLGTVVAGSVLSLGAGPMTRAYAAPAIRGLISPGARRSKVRVAKIYLGIPGALWPTPKMGIKDEMRAYEGRFAERAQAFADVDFVLNSLVSTLEEAKAAAAKLDDVDGVLAIHLSMGIMPLLKVILEARKPTVLYAAPYSGHEWTGFGDLRRQPLGAALECMLTSDFGQMEAAVRPFRAIHHLREAKILNVTARKPKAGYLNAIKERFGTEIIVVSRQQVLDAYEAADEAAAKAEAQRWIEGAEAVVEPSHEEIEKSCRLALAFELLMDQEQATCITVDCYGSMYRKLPAFPCIGFTRLNDMGLAGICESDLESAISFILLQALSGKPGFISDPTVDESKDAIILAHCMGTTKMEGPDGPACPYKLRSIMERQEGAVPQVRMDLNQKVTQIKLIGNDLLLYFTGDIIEAPDIHRGCRTKITVRVDGDNEALWQNWSHGLHRVTCYGDVVNDLKRFCRFKGVQMLHEAGAANFT